MVCSLMVLFGLQAGYRIAFPPCAPFQKEYQRIFNVQDAFVSATPKKTSTCNSKVHAYCQLGGNDCSTKTSKYQTINSTSQTTWILLEFSRKSAFTADMTNTLYNLTKSLQKVLSYRTDGKCPCAAALQKDFI